MQIVITKRKINRPFSQGPFTQKRHGSATVCATVVAINEAPKQTPEKKAGSMALFNMNIEEKKAGTGEDGFFGNNLTTLYIIMVNARLAWWILGVQPKQWRNQADTNTQILNLRIDIGNQGHDFFGSIIVVGLGFITRDISPQSFDLVTRLVAQPWRASVIGPLDETVIFATYFNDRLFNSPDIRTGSRAKRVDVKTRPKLCNFEGQQFILNQFCLCL